MKKFLTILFLSVITSICYAQMPTVLGVKFGSSIEETEQILSKRFGSVKVWNSGGKLRMIDAPARSATKSQLLSQT